MLLCTHFIYIYIYIKYYTHNIYNMVERNLCDKEIIIHIKSNKKITR